MMAAAEFQPDWASPPGDTIRDILDERSLSVSDFAAILGKTPESAVHLLEGRIPITLGLAEELGRTLGGSAEFWMSRDGQYRADSDRLHAQGREWLRTVPIGDMVRFGWLRPPPRPSEEVEACLQFFGVSSVSSWHERYGAVEELVAFRTSPTFESRPAALAAWLRQGEIEAGELACRPWDPAGFREALVETRSLTQQKEPGLFLPALKELCAAHGVAAVVVRAPNGCRASGATRFLSPTKAMLLLSFRYLSDDHFWFTFFHEAGHLLLHGHREVFVEGLGEGTSSQEREANRFAEDVLIPGNLKAALLRLPTERKAILRFARDCGVSPGIVVGQLQHLGRVRRDHFNGLKRTYRWDEAE